jgi:hypothetical protein
VSRKAAHHEFLLLRREARRVHHVEPEGHPAGYLVNVVDYLAGEGEHGLSGAQEAIISNTSLSTELIGRRLLLNHLF